MKKRIVLAFVILALGVLSGFVVGRFWCDDASSSSTAKILPLKVYQQETEYSCGGASIKALLDYYGMLGGRSESDISRDLGTRFETPNPGTHPDGVVAYLKALGLIVESGENGSMDMIYHYLDQRVPVVVLDSTWGGHWRVLIGYDFHGDRAKWEDNDVFFADPEYRAIEPIVDRSTGVLTENESRFQYEWYENRLFEKPRESFYVVAYPAEWNVEPFTAEE